VHLIGFFYKKRFTVAESKCTAGDKRIRPTTELYSRNFL